MTRVLRAAPMIALLLAAASFVPPITAAVAQDNHPGTEAQKRACRPDVYRLCAGEVPNVRRITSCLRSNMSRLSPDCRAVFEGTLR